MNGAWSKITLIGIAIALQGCMMQPQKIHIDPQLSLAKPASGVGGKVVAVEALDSRKVKVLGMVGVPEARHAEISSPEDAGPALYVRTVAALENLGFTAKPVTENDDRVLHVELTNLEYQTIKGKFVADDVQMSVTLVGRARNKDEWLDRQFIVTKKKAVGVLPGVEENTRFINQAIAQALKDMLADPKLLTLLSK